MKVRVGVILIVFMLCVSMFGAVGSVFSKPSFEGTGAISSVYISNMKSSIDTLETTVNKYLNMDANNYEPCERTQSTIALPWMNLNNSLL